MFTPLLCFLRGLINEALAMPMAQAVSHRLPTTLTWVRSQVIVGFVVDKVTLGHVFSEYFGFPCQFSFQQILHTSSIIRG
jgi:hypothetical protein